MRLYNTLTKQIEELKLQGNPVVKIYTCGPTVYDFAHVGHWFNYIRMDNLIRTLKFAGLKPIWVMNITDVGHLVSDADEGEDKLEKGARREGKTAWQVADFYTKDFLSDMRQLNITKPSQIVRATDHIAEQINLIKQLEDKGYTYQIDDGLYYDTSKFKNYSKFAGLDIDEQQGSERVPKNPQKHHPADFALWKLSPNDHKRDMEWDSPWGRGFPGWHIECSAMSLKYLGPTLDIHTGGIDHIPVHHTNEIAQAEPVTGVPLANYWFHSNHVLIAGEKISKSLGNSIRLQEVEQNGFSPEVLRLHVLESHYRSQSRFSWESLTAAKNRLADLKAMAVLRYQPRALSHDSPTFALEEALDQFSQFFYEDLNTPAALAFLSEIVVQLLAVHIEADMVDHFNRLLGGIDNLTGLSLMKIPDISDDQRALIQKRENARQNKDWPEADKLRQQLHKLGVGIQDHQHGPTWYPVS